MSGEQKKFIWIIVTVAITAIVAQIVVGFGVLNRDHFTIKSNNEKILDMQEDIRDTG